MTDNQNCDTIKGFKIVLANHANHHFQAIVCFTVKSFLQHLFVSLKYYVCFRYEKHAYGQRIALIFFTRFHKYRTKSENSKVQTITEVYFKEGDYLYKNCGSSHGGVQSLRKGQQVPRVACQHMSEGHLEKVALSVL